MNPVEHDAVRDAKIALAKPREMLCVQRRYPPLIDPPQAAPQEQQHQHNVRALIAFAEHGLQRRLQCHRRPAEIADHTAAMLRRDPVM
jgi:hypothetical protein